MMTVRDAIAGETLEVGEAFRVLPPVPAASVEPAAATPARMTPS